MFNTSDNSQTEEFNAEIPKPIPQQKEEIAKERQSAASIDPLKKLSNKHIEVAAPTFINNSLNTPVYNPISMNVKSKGFGFSLRPSTMGFILVYLFMVSLTALLVVIF